MDEDVLGITILNDESVTLLIVEPLYFSAGHNACLGLVSIGSRRRVSNKKRRKDIAVRVLLKLSDTTTYDLTYF